MTRHAVGLDPHEPFAQAAARIVRMRADEMVAGDDGVLDVLDAERVHDMRVATRRLRAVLELFAAAFDKAELKPVLRDVKALADALGERRDPDVQIAALEQLAPVAPMAVHTVVLRLSARREQADAALADALARARESDLHGRLHALADAAEQAVA
jgi:CHAD domain-containing protein